MPKKRNSPSTPADCGASYDHAWHSYKTPRGKIKVCDGSTTKRATRQGEDK